MSAPGLAAFQQRFAAALAAPEASAEPWAGASFTPALAVYRNTVATACIDALAAAYPTVAQMVGQAWFAAAALAFMATQPPADPRMTEFGGGFPDWLAAFPPAQDLPYLAPCARLDRAWLEAHLAPGAPAARGLTPPPASAALAPHPSLRLFRFGANVPSLWRAHRAEATPGPLDFVPAEEALAIWRPELAVEVRMLRPAEYAFLRACQDGATVAAALARAIAAAPPAEAAQTLRLPSTLISSGFFIGLRPGAPLP